MIYTVSIEEVGRFWNLDEEQLELIYSLDRDELVIPLIWAYLRVLFRETVADQWVHRPNTYFEDKSALELILDGRMHEVKDYLESEIYKA